MELAKAGFAGDSLERILFYIEHHDAFISFKLSYEIKNRNNPYIVPIEKDNVIDKIASIQKEYKIKGQYVPCNKDFALLLRLSIADAKAQSKEVIQNGILIDSMESKVKRLENILKIIESA